MYKYPTPGQQAVPKLGHSAWLLRSHLEAWPILGHKRPTKSDSAWSPAWAKVLPWPATQPGTQIRQMKSGCRMLSCPQAHFTQDWQNLLASSYQIWLSSLLGLVHRKGAEEEAMQREGIKIESPYRLSLEIILFLQGDGKTPRIFINKAVLIIRASGKSTSLSLEMFCNLELEFVVSHVWSIIFHCFALKCRYCVYIYHLPHKQEDWAPMPRTCMKPAWS